MKTILIMIPEKIKCYIKEILPNEKIKNCDYFEAKNFQEVYELSLKHELDVVIINQDLEENEEQIIIPYLNQKNTATVFIPYKQNIRNRIKKRLKSTLKQNHSSLFLVLVQCTAFCIEVILNQQ